MELVAEVLAERCGLRARLYRMQGNIYRLRFAGMGWAPSRLRDQADGMKRLLACQSYGPDEVEMLRKICRADIG